MAAYLTLIDGSIWFPYGIDREKNIVHPRQWQAAALPDNSQCPCADQRS